MSDQVQCSCGTTLGWNFTPPRQDQIKCPNCTTIHQATEATRVPQPTDWSSPGGYVVVSFTGSADGWCSLARCPMGTTEWFPTDELARQYAGSLPPGFEPHILMVK